MGAILCMVAGSVIVIKPAKIKSRQLDTRFAAVRGNVSCLLYYILPTVPRFKSLKRFIHHKSRSMLIDDGCYHSKVPPFAGAQSSNVWFLVPFHGSKHLQNLRPSRL